MTRMRVCRENVFPRRFVGARLSHQSERHLRNLHRVEFNLLLRKRSVKKSRFFTPIVSFPPPRRVTKIKTSHLFPLGRLSIDHSPLALLGAIKVVIRSGIDVEYEAFAHILPSPFAHEIAPSFSISPFLLSEAVVAAQISHQRKTCQSL